MKLLESLAAALIVAAVVLVLAWRAEADMVTLPAVAFLVAFVPFMLRTRASTYTRTRSTRSRSRRR